MLRGEIRLTDLDPVRGSEASKRRPAVIVSNDRANAVASRLGRGVVTVVPVTSNTARIFPFQTALPAAETGLRHDSKAQAEQVRSVATERLGVVLGHVPPRIMADLDEALRLHLHL
jgi:mRNA interferase MazF